MIFQILLVLLALLVIACLIGGLLVVTEIHQSRKDANSRLALRVSRAWRS
jgi:hypothetical protein